MILLQRTTSENPGFQLLISLLDSELRGNYGNLQDHYAQFNKINEIETVLVAFDGDLVVGCGCFKYFSEKTVEIKRMFVRPEYRGIGISKKILGELEKWAVELGYIIAILETGVKQTTAIELYHSYGYSNIPNFGQYQGNLNSICMQKNLVTR